jgi:hypothetical protein
MFREHNLRVTCRIQCTPTQPPRALLRLQSEADALEEPGTSNNTASERAGLERVSRANLKYALNIWNTVDQSHYRCYLLWRS